MQSSGQPMGKSPSPATVLCVDDDRTVLAAIRSLLGKNSQPVVVEVAESGEEALEILGELADRGLGVAVVVSDYIMPGMKGDELLVRIHQRDPRVFNIMLTGQSDVQGVKRAINDAALYRFLEKPFNNADFLLTINAAIKAYGQARELEHKNAQLQRLNEDLERHNVTLEQIVAQRTAELQEKNQLLEKLATTDRLTGLFNRLHLDRLLAQEWARFQRQHMPFSLILLDIDRFKSVNDSFGHQVGDSVLVEVARVLHSHVRCTDVVGRWGGEEFLVVCIDTDLDEAVAVAEKLRVALASHPIALTGPKTGSFGVSSSCAVDNLDGMVARADAALYRAKNAGRNRVEKG